MNLTLFARIERYLKARSTPFLAVLGVLLVLLVGVADYFTGAELSLSIFYLIPIVVMTWSLSRRVGVFFAIFSSGIELITDLAAGEHYSHPIILYWNNAVHLGFYFVIVSILSILRNEYEKTVKLNATLQSSLMDLSRTKEELEQKTQDLVRSNGELEQFASMAAHDLREPLVVVGGYVNHLKRLFISENVPEAERLIMRCLEGVGRMEALIESILAYARAGKIAKEFKWVDCNNIVKLAIGNLQVKVRERGAMITYDLLPSFWADEIQLIQLFQNLILNGIKFCRKESPRIHVSIERKAREWIFAVQDNGIGIATEHQTAVFDVFKRLNSRSEYSGNGIGLAICKKVVENHGGRIWVESCPGEGSTFRFAIPIRDSDLSLLKT